MSRIAVLGTGAWGTALALAWSAQHQLASEHGVEMPIVEQMHAILYEGRSPRDAIQQLIARPGPAE